MKLSPITFRLAVCAVTLAALCAVAADSRASSEITSDIGGGTLTLGSANTYTGATSATLNTANGAALSSSSGVILKGNVLASAGSGVLASGGTIPPGLFGSVNDLNFKNTSKGATRAKATVDLANTSSTSLRNVTATVYLSDDNTLSADDTKIVTLNLSDYVAKGKVAKHGTVQLPFNYKVPSLVASYLNGKYLIIVLSADNLGSLETTPVVVGPITLP